MISFRTDEDRRAYANARRAELRAAGMCINGPISGFVGSHGTQHGPVVSGGKCQRCIDTHRDRHPYVHAGIDRAVLLAMPSYRVLRELARHESLTVRSFDISLPHRRVSWTLRYLVSQRRVERMSRGRNAKYRVTERGHNWLRDMVAKINVSP